MLHQIFSLLLEALASVVGGACLLRLYMQTLRIPMSARSGNPLGRLVFALSDWLVLPLRRFVPALAGLDTASLLAVFLVQLAQFSLLWLWSGLASGYGAVVILALFGVLRLALSGLTGLVIVYAVLSWVQSNTVLSDVMQRLVTPLLAPIRRWLPLMGGVDLSPLVLLLLLQVAAIVLGGLQAQALL